mgnify:CR=1 FL=1
MKHNSDNTVFVLDVDGTLTNGNMYYSKDGKKLKAFSCDDWDALKEISNFMQLCFITADKKGFPITQKRIEEEMGWDLNLVSPYPKERWEWMKQQFPDKKIFFMADGIYDYYALEKCYFGITTKNALEYTKRSANIMIEKNGGDRAVAAACIYLMEQFNWDWKAKYK